RPTSAASVVQPSNPVSKSPVGKTVPSEVVTVSVTSSILKSGISAASGFAVQSFSKKAQSQSLVEAVNSASRADHSPLVATVLVITSQTSPAKSLGHSVKLNFLVGSPSSY